MMRTLILSTLIYLCFTHIHAVPLQQRGIFDPLESLADSVFGISTAPAATTDVLPTQTTADPDVTPITLSADSATSITAASEPSQSTADGSKSSTTSDTKQPSETVVISTAQTTLNPSTTSSLTTSTRTNTPLRPSSTEIPPAPLNTSNGVQPSPKPSIGTQSQASSGNKISAAGIAIAVILSVAVLSVAAYLIFKFCPPVQRRYQAWQERKMKARTYREALDGPGSYSAARKGLGLGEVEKLKTKPRPFSFQFQFHSQQQQHDPIRQEIKRKPLPWNAAVAGNAGPAVGVAVPLDQHHG